MWTALASLFGVILAGVMLYVNNESRIRKRKLWEHIRWLEDELAKELDKGDSARVDFLNDELIRLRQVQHSLSS